MFNEMLPVSGTGKDPIKFMVFDYDTWTADDHIGSVELSPEELLGIMERGDVTQALTLPLGYGKARLDIEISFTNLS